MKKLKTLIFLLLLTFVSCQRTTVLNELKEETKESNLTKIQNESFVERIIPHPINCFDLPNILDKVRKRDQQNRSNEILLEIDRKNLEIVVSILETCGMPTLKQVERKHLTTIWLVLQHGDHYHRKKYFPYIEKAIKDEELPKSCYALMKDRILVSEGKPQLFGTQIGSLIDHEKKLIVHEIEDPEYVDQRRAEMGLGPINEYLAMWETSLDVEQKRR